MTYKTILVGLNYLERNQALLTSAAALAQACDAHLRGIYVIPAIEVYVGAGFGGDTIIFEGKRDLYRNAEASIRKEFDSILQKAGIRGDLVVIDSDSPAITDHVVQYALWSDVMVISQPPEEAGLSVGGREIVERLLLSTGRPTLVLPRKGSTSLMANLVIVGWHGKRESARAAFDSLPLLKNAKKVHVVWVDPEKEYPHPGSLPGEEIAASLSRHGVNVVVEPVSTGGTDAGEALLTKVADSGAELLVMGAYGHWRLTEMILGGATRSVLRGMKCPVLFSH